MRARFCGRSVLVGLAAVVAGHAYAAEPVWTELKVGSWPAGWEVSGEAFAEGPTSGAVEPVSDTTGSVKKDLHFNFAEFPQMYRQSALGVADSAVINSYHPRTLERATGRLVSPPFTVSSPALSFQIAGRPTHGRLAVNLIVDGQVVRQALPRRNRFETCTFDLSGLAGKSARLEFVDQDPYIGSWLAVADVANEQSSEYHQGPHHPIGRSRAGSSPRSNVR